MYRRDLAVHLLDEIHTGRMLKRFRDLQRENQHLITQLEKKRTNLDAVTEKLNRIQAQKKMENSQER